MKLLLPVLLMTLAVVCNSAVLPNVSRYNLSVGYVQQGDRLLQRSSLYQPARPNAIQYQDYIYRGNYTTRITAVVATEVGYTQYASAWIMSGGIGYNSVTIRVQSAWGYGFNYVIDIWGR
ncbi:uncharacterized protein LOC123665507 [Melitaea cinxia]|uniref:uncharacterized protein LOC123665507 n=1 Tax=Melitaea cinxia TaxID=113334 RepID=UPI001E27051D|nr:uncharacterized protein LOC123665507 [Melitaea cinxia]